MKRGILFLIPIVLLVSTSIAQETIKVKIDALVKNGVALKEKEKMQRFSEIYLEYQFQIHPEFGTFVGKTDNNNKWTDFSFEGMEQEKKDRVLLLNALKSINRLKLDAAEQLNYDLLKGTIELEREGEVFQSELMPIDQRYGFHHMIVRVLIATPIRSRKDVEDFLTRLQKTATLIDQLILLMDKGIEKNITAPKITLLDVPSQIQSIIGTEPAKSTLLKNLNAYLAKQSSEYKEQTLSKALKITAEILYPSLSKLKTYIEKTYIPNARETIALKDLPNGENWYNYKIKSHTTTSLTYKEIYEIGLSEVKRIRKVMDSIIKAIGFKGSSEEFASFLRTDRSFFYEDSAQLLDGYRVIAKKIDPQLPKLFGKLPRLSYGIEPVPAYEEKSKSSAYYVGGSTKAGRPGVFYANTYNLMSRPKWEMEVLTIHEAVPGHHLQLSLQEELENVAEFRKYINYTSYAEGWGLYSESLGEEMGFYKDPYSKFGQLTYEMWRAVRLVIDPGIHGLGWTRQQAIDYFIANTAKSELEITVEVDRYIAQPGQALAYKIGELKIQELRTEAQMKLGDKFDIRQFHDVVLANGAIPLDILTQKVSEWINSIK